ncbi:MAG: NPCBM/NEW2 domain-containing protein [Planctomycetia bacterium]|nr:NPCBM/NEW2 domain-containing protein [Planctomycetia bacterium]
MRRRVLIFAAGIAIYAALAGTLPAQEAPPVLTTVDGASQPATLQRISADWQMTLDAGGKPLVVPAADVVSWGRPVDPPAQPRIEPVDAAQILFTDGGLVVADIYELAAGEDLLVADSGVLREIRAPLDRVAGVLLRPPPDALRRDEWIKTVLSPAGGDARQSDRVILDNGDVLAGTVKSITRSQIEFLSAGSSFKLETGRVAAVAFNPALASRAPAKGLRAIVGLADGSRLLATGLTVSDEGARIVTAEGTWTVPRENLVFLQVLGGKAVYLSDLKPTDYRHIPFLSVAWDYRLDRNVEGTQLRSGGRAHFKGIGMHSTSRLTFDLEGPYRRLDAIAALDDRVGQKGSVTFRVFADNKEAFKGEIVRGSVPPGKSGVPLSVDLTGAQRVSLVVDFAEQGDVLDHADWLDVRLVK